MEANGTAQVRTASGSSTESALIQRVLAGETELFYELIEPYERAVYRAAITIVRNSEDAEEVAQEAVLKAFRSLKEFRGEAKFSTWLIQITVNEARMRVRKNRSDRYTFLDAAPDESERDYHPLVLADWREIPSEALEKKEVREMIGRAIAQLPEKYREIILLRDVQQFNIAETAVALGVDIGAVKTRLLRARLRLRDLLAPHLQSISFKRRREKGTNPWR